jgi:cyclase
MWPDVDWGTVDIRLPELTFRDGLTLRLGNHQAELIVVGPAHTIADTVVWLPEERVLFAGDVVMPGCTPFLLMGSVAGSLRAVSALRALEPRVVVGGHGPVSGPEVFGETEDYLRWLLQTAKETMAAGLTPLEAAGAAGPGDFADWLDPERLVGNLHRAYSELRGESEGAELDVVGIFGEMVAYNGGQLPTCSA